MGIIWQYLDKRGATANALRDYGRMEFIISHTDDKVKAVHEKMGGVSSPQFDGSPMRRGRIVPRRKRACGGGQDGGRDG